MIKQLLPIIFLIYQLSATRSLLQRVQPTIPTQPVLPLPNPPVQTHVQIIPPVSIPLPTTVIQPPAQTIPPVQTLPPLAPLPVPVQTTSPTGFAFGAFGQLCPVPTTPAQCQSATDILTDAGVGKIQCTDTADCCMCSSIECGYIGESCRALRFGPSAAFGVQNIRTFGAQTGIGTFITCQGTKSCANANIQAEYVAEIECNGADSCANAVMIIDNPSVGFSLDCAGQNSCAGLQIFITIPTPVAGCPTPTTGHLFDFGGVECMGENSCSDLQISITNNGCTPILIEDINCVAINSCSNAIFSLTGPIEIQNCQCGPSCDSVLGLEKCFSSISEVLCPDPLSCMGRHEIISNPVNGFEMVCGALQSCENSNFLFELTPPDTGLTGITVWEGFVFSGSNSGRGAVITIQNRQGNDVNGVAIVLTIQEIDCAEIGACEGLTIVTSENVIIADFICKVGACNGCTVNGIACDPAQLQTMPPLVQPLPLPVVPQQPV